jgi:hypothetical protein
VTHAKQTKSAKTAGRNGVNRIIVSPAVDLIASPIAAL